MKASHLLEDFFNEKLLNLFQGNSPMTEAKIEQDLGVILGCKRELNIIVSNN